MSIANNWEDQYKNLGIIAAANLVQGFNPEIAVRFDNPHYETPLPYFKATYRNQKTNVLHWLVGIQLPEGSPRVTRGTGVEAGDEADEVIEGNYARALDVMESPTEKELRAQAWNVVMHFLNEAGA